MLISIAKKIAEEGEKRNLIIVLGSTNINRNELVNNLFNKFNKDYIGCYTRYYITMDLARDIIKKSGNDPDVYWEDTALKWQEIFAKQEEYKDQIVETEFLIEKDEDGGVIGALLKDTRYKNAIISTIKTNKELEFTLKHNTIFVYLKFDKNEDFNGELISKIPSDKLLILEEGYNLSEKFKQIKEMLKIV